MINTNATLEQLEQLRLNGMAQAYRGSLALPTHEQPQIPMAVSRYKVCVQVGHTKLKYHS